MLDLLKRHVVNFLTMLSLFACAGCAVLWVRNLWAADHFSHTTIDDRGRMTGYFGLWTWWGSVVLDYSRLDAPSEMFVWGAGDGPPLLNYSRWPADPATPPFDRRNVRLFAGFGWGTYRYSMLESNLPGHSTFTRTMPTGTSRVVVVPWYFLILVTGLLPLARLRAFLRRRRRIRAGLCLTCGYDLRGSADAGRCPECGTATGVPSGRKGMV